LKKAQYFDWNCKFLPRLDKYGEVRFNGSKPLYEILSDCPANLIDFIEKSMSWDPLQRMKPSEALVHPWILDGLPEQIRFYRFLIL
jgi:dual specificity tyrosine-phosphorylation-regulated kinase 2/3/4